MSGVTMRIHSNTTSTVADKASGRSDWNNSSAAPDPFFNSFVRAAANVMKSTVTATETEAQQIEALVTGAQRPPREPA